MIRYIFVRRCRDLEYGVDIVEHWDYSGVMELCSGHVNMSSCHEPVM